MTSNKNEKKGYWKGKKRSEETKRKISKTKFKKESKKLKENYKKLSPAKAYILGCLCGDASIYYRNNEISLEAKDKDFVDKFAEEFKKAYGISMNWGQKIESNNLNEKTRYRCRKASAPIYEDITSYHPNFKTKEWEIPKEIFNGCEENKIAFLLGLFDSDGNTNTDWLEITLTSINLKGLRQVKKLLRELGIQSSIFKFKSLKSKHLVVDSRKKFTEKIGFSINRKNKTLRKNLQKARFIDHSTKMLKKARELRKEGLSYGKIGDKLGVSKQTIWQWLNTSQVPFNKHKKKKRFNSNFE